MYRAKNIARYIVDKCIRDGCPVNNLQLQQLLFLIQKRYDEEQGLPCFADDMETRPFGPCCPNVYYQYCHYGVMPITFSFDSVPILPAKDKYVIDSVIGEFICRSSSFQTIRIKEVVL